MLCFLHMETLKHIIDNQNVTYLFSISGLRCVSLLRVSRLFKNTRYKSSATHKHLWNYLRHTKEIFDVSLPQRSTGVLATLALLNKPCLFEVHGFEQTTKQCMLKYLQIWHLFNSASSTLQLHKRHLGGSEMQTGPHKSLCVKASKWARVVFFSVCELSYAIPELGLWGWVNKYSHPFQRPVCFYQRDACSAADGFLLQTRAFWWYCAR